MTNPNRTPDEADTDDLTRILEPLITPRPTPPGGYPKTLCELLDECRIPSRPHNRDCARRIVLALERLAALSAEGGTSRWLA
jgi:hypothetical protein